MHLSFDLEGIKMKVDFYKNFIFRAFWIFPFLVLAVLQTSCQRQSEYVAPPPPQVVVSKPTIQSVTEFAEFSGTTQPYEFVEARARVEGYLESIHFQPGRLVEKGHLLFTIDPKPFQAKLDEAQAELEQRQAQLQQAEAAVKRKEMAFRANAISELEVIQARADREVARAAIQGVRAAIETAKINLSYTRIHAPISGRIGRSLVDLGNLVGSSENTLLTTIVQDNPVYAYFHINERDFIYYQAGRTGTDGPTNGDGQARLELGLAGNDKYPFEGHIDFVDNRVDPSTGTIQVRGVFPNPERKLWPGLFVRIRAPLGITENALMVPDVALGSDQRGRFLLTVNEENVVEYRSVRVGALVNGLREIKDGISADEKVIVAGVQSARPGLKVMVKEEDGQKDSSSRLVGKVQ